MGQQKWYRAGLWWGWWLIGQEELGIMNILRDGDPDGGSGSFLLGYSGACYARRAFEPLGSLKTHRYHLLQDYESLGPGTHI